MSMKMTGGGGQLVYSNHNRYEVALSDCVPGGEVTRKWLNGRDEVDWWRTPFFGGTSSGATQILF